MQNRAKYDQSTIEPGLAGLTKEHIQAASSEAKKQNISLYQSILKLGIVTESKFLTAVSEKTGLELTSLQIDHIQQEACDAISAKVVSHYQVMPVKLQDNTLWIATSDPFSRDLKHELELIIDKKHQIMFMLATADSIKKVFRKVYGLGAATVEQMMAHEEIASESGNQEDLSDESKAHDASVTKLVNHILADSINAEATDIHIEPYEDELRVRFRVDGILHDAGIPPSAKHFREGIISRIKILSGLDIAEKRLPQDGRAQITLKGSSFDLRISVLPSRYGEAINIRILPRGTMISDLPSLGMPTHNVQELARLITKPHGIILVTGPTGSGKTTTLYTCMNMLNSIDRKIITIEDPVEYDMSGIIQMQVHPDIGFTFARALRSILRHDPDVILVGEIRDLETAETAIRTALTGHLVFSTLHTNNAASAITRLQDMGIEPYLAASSIEAILAQRLVRVICPECKEPDTPEPEIATAIKSMMNLTELPISHKGRGCSKCRFTGYHGRTIITEMMVVSEQIRKMTVNRRHAPEIHETAEKEGMTPLFQCGIQKVHDGITTYDEILRVTDGTILTE
jgi:type II secretory ATPase GspE/PulE/Tfp pilus assembly ATPase PilB-like protein